MNRRAVAAVIALLGAPRTAHAQCPDGAPPPCSRTAAPVRAAAPPAAERGRRFLILPFRNITRAPEQDWLVEGSTTILGDALARWQEITVVADDRLYPALHRHGLAPGALMDPQRVRRVAEETGGWTAVSGEVITTGGRVRVSARAVDVISGRELARSAGEVPAGGDVRLAFDQVAAGLLPAAGLSAASAGLAPPATRSLDAYRAYLRGVAQIHRSRYRQARDALREAIGLDSNFAEAYVLLAQSMLFINPMSLLDATNPAQRYAARGAELAAQLPPRQRDLAVALHDMFQGQVTAARTALERVLAADSGNVTALGQMGLLEWGDPILVPVAGGERPRGSLNRSNRLSRRVLELDPDNHAVYLPLTLSHLYAGGDLPGIVVGTRREGASFRDLVLGGTPRLFVTLFQADSIILVPAESLAAWPAESLAVSRQRALTVARAWSDRWLGVGRDEAEAHLTASRVAHRQGELVRALAELDTAVAMGVESGISAPAYSRITILAKLGRYDAARARADSLLDAGRFDHLIPLPSEWIEAEVWAFNLWLMHGDFGRAQAVRDRLAASLSAFGIMTDSAMAGLVAFPLLAGNAVPPMWLFGLPAVFRAQVMDSVWARRASIPEGSTLERSLSLLQHLVSVAAVADSAAAARARAAPWYRP